MKTATIPSLRVDPELRRAAESVLMDDESLSSFVEQSIRAAVNQRRMRSEFIARGLAARDEAARTGEYYAAAEVLTELDGMLNEAAAKTGR